MKMSKKYTGVACFDIDGVLANVEEDFCEKFGYDNRHLYSFYERYPDVDPDLITEFLTNEYVYKELNVIFGGRLLVQQALERGFYVILMTSRPKHLNAVTRNWLELYNVQYNELLFLSDKSEELGNRKAMFLVDDYPKHLQAVPKGVVGIAWEQKWNEGYYPRARYNENLMRVEVKLTGSSSWRDFWSEKK